MEDHNSRVESELKTTQKLYYKANYRDFPPYQIDSYQASYENICAEIDELHLRHRNRLVFMVKQSYQLILQQMLDCHQTQKVCAETGIRFLSGFDAEPKEILPEGYTAYSSVYTSNPGFQNSSADLEDKSLTCDPNTISNNRHHIHSRRQDSNINNTNKNDVGVSAEGTNEESRLSLSALSLSPAPQKVGPNNGYTFFSTVSDENAMISGTAATGIGNCSGIMSHSIGSNGVDGMNQDHHNSRNEASAEHLMSNRRKGRELGPSDINIGVQSFQHSTQSLLQQQQQRQSVFGTTSRTMVLGEKGTNRDTQENDGEEGDDDDDDDGNGYSEDEDEKIIKPTLQSYPTISSPFSGFKGINSYRYG